MTLIIFVCVFAYVAHHFMMIANIDATRDCNIRSRDMSNVTHYDYVNASFNRHGRSIVRTQSQHVI